ncbi:ATP-grasp domain-containing protein [Limosilactobacillus caecicola]|uniref:ATP-grasp domain-containing protein n=1 Tax=Limosilactobacillus caecicola TaxID=2941332 RepID=UPI00203F5315|nr:ATP-grasp domain-containing protein [Limosilactobacillus caecicola]
MSKNVLYQGNTLGIMGIDRNGKKLILAAKEAGLNVGVYLDHSEPETTKQADFTVIGNYRDKDKLTEFGENCDAVIYETAAIDSIVIKYLSQYTAIPQGLDPLEIMQDRLMERAFLDQINVNVAPYVTVISLDDIYQSIDSIGYPAVLKPIQRGVGEDALMINKESDIARAADFIQAGTYLLESWIDHTAEYAITMAIDGDGNHLYPLSELQYVGNHQLQAVKSPVTVPDDMNKEMKRIANSIGDQLGYQGIISVNFYVTSTGNLYVKDLEPGVSTSGNIFTESTNVSQSEQQIRISAGRPAHFIHETQPAIFLIGRQPQLSALERQVLIRDNWKFSFFEPAQDSADDVLAYVWATGDGETVDEIQSQVDETGVWEDDAPVEDNESSSI